MAILFVSGVNDLSTVGIQTDKDGNVVHMTDGNGPVYGRIPFKQGMAAYLVLFGLGVKQRMVNFKRPPSLIFNQIADAETHRGSLQRCAELCESVSSPVINQPKRILHTTRELVSGLLQEIPGVVMPKTMRFQPLSPRAVFEYAKTVDIDLPFMVRVADDLTGKSRVLVRNPDDRALLNALPFDGRDFLLTEFVDFKDNEGLYHRIRLLVVDGEAVLRDALFNSDWKIPGSSHAFMLSRETWEGHAERCRRFETEVLPALASRVSEIKRRLDLEYFGIDCHINADGEMLVFEAGANMDMLLNPHPELNGRMEMIQQKIHALINRHSGEVVI